MNILLKLLTKIGLRKEPIKPNEKKSSVPFEQKAIKLEANNYLTNKIVVYYEEDENTKINDYLLANYDRINDALEKKGMRFFYLPKILNGDNRALIEELFKFSAYEYPDIFCGEYEQNKALIIDTFRQLDVKSYYSLIKTSLGIPDGTGPCFINCRDSGNIINSFSEFRYLFASFREDIIEECVNIYLEKVYIPESNIYFQKRSYEDEYDADDRFYNDSNKISDETAAYIEKLKSLNNEKLLISSLVQIIKSLKDVEPGIAEKINTALYNNIKEADTKPSRLYIDKQYRIYLPDYNNLEIEMTPLPKAVYLFFLKHPEGIRFKELSDYRKELIDIYCKVGNRLDMEQINKSITELTNIRSNSINEKCSRIKEAFVSKIDDSIAKQYYITGDRDENKLVQLEPSLILFEEIN